MGFASELLSNIIVSLLGALALWLITRAIKRIRDHRINKAFPVAGTYMTSYEDHIDGKPVVVKAIAKVHQQGNKITGETRPLNSDRVWTLSGQLSSTGRIIGSYEAQDPYDTGLGSFFLEFEGEGILDGIWSGFDSVNKRPEAGRYRFRKVPEMRLDTLNSENLSAALSALGNALGERYISLEELAEYTTEGSDPTKFGVVIYNDSILVGAATADFFEDGSSFLETVPEDMRERVSKLIPSLKFNRIVLIHSVAVDSQFRERGNATRMIRELLSRGVEMGATNAVAIGWTDSEGCHIEGTLSALGFNARAVIEDYWHEDSKIHGYSCPSCPDRCHCSATLMVNDSLCSIEIARRDYV